MFNLKKVIASVAALAMSLSCFTAFAADFSDVEATASYKNAIDELVALEIVNGYEDGTFKPDNEITRAEVTKMVVAAMGPSYTQAAESSVGGSGFSDVDAAGHWASGFIAVGVAQEFINGMGDGTFAPNANVTYAQIVKMLVAALGYSTAAEYNGGYPNGYLQMGNSTGITAGITGVSQDTPVTRAQVAQLISNAIDTPLVLVTGWETNYITGEPVAKTEVMDGEDGRSYKTLLTENHDAYKVKGRVRATHAQSGKKVGEVDFRVENAANYNGEDYKAYYDMATSTWKDYTDVTDAAVGDTNAEDLLFTYAEALIALNADDEATILTITPYGKNDIYTLAAKDFAGYTDATVDTLDFYASETSSKTKQYKLDGAVQLYINGVQLDRNVVYDETVVDYDINGDTDKSDTTETVAPISEFNFVQFIERNAIGTVTLIDSPAMGQTSKDGKIDYIMIDVAKWAMVEAAMVEGDDLVIYLKEFETNFVDTPITLDTTDESLVYEFTKNGEVVDFADIKKNDVLLVKYNVLNFAGNAWTTTTATNSAFVEIDICDTVVEGAVTGIKTVDGVPVYTINGADYKSIDGALTATDEYRVFLDSAGRIVKKEKLATSANYGIVDRVYKDNDTQDYKIRVIKADGTRTSFVAKDAATAAAAANIAYTSSDYGTDSTLDAGEELDGTLDTTLKNRVVQYKINSSKEINSIVAIGDAAAITTDTEYNETTLKVGSARMSEATQILDLTKYNLTSAAADIKAGSLASFVDGEEYQVVYADKNPSDNTYGFVIIMAGNDSITATASIAVVDNISTASGDDGASVDVINAYTADAAEMVALTVDEDAVCKDRTGSTIVVNNTNLPRGTVVAIATDAAGVVTEVRELYKVGTAAPTVWGYTSASDPMGGSNKYFNSGITEWDSSSLTNNNWTRVGFGIVTDKIEQTLYVARRNAVDTASGQPDNDIAAIVGSGSSYDIQTGAIITRENEIDELSVASDVNVFVYDYSKRAGAEISKGAYGSIVKTFVPETSIVSNGGEDIIDWTAFDASLKTPNYVFYKVTNDEITDIVFIKPAV